MQSAGNFAMRVLIALCVMTALLPPSATAHSWYPHECCSGIDCREVPAKNISERPEGYVIKNTGEIVRYGDRRVKDSPDGEYHWCSVAGADDTRTICLFVPPRLF